MKIQVIRSSTGTPEWQKHESDQVSRSRVRDRRSRVAVESEVRGIGVVWKLEANSVAEAWVKWADYSNIRVQPGHQEDMDLEPC